MPASLEYCLRIMQDLERRITDLELSASRRESASPPSAPPRGERAGIGHAGNNDGGSGRTGIAETLIRPDAIYPVLKFGEGKPAAAAPVKAALEEVPRVCEQIKLLWFYPECEQLLDKLIIDDRGNRSGFRREVMEELLFLARLSRAVKMGNSLSPASRVPERTDVWQDQRRERRA